MKLSTMNSHPLPLPSRSTLEGLPLLECIWLQK